MKPVEDEFLARLRSTVRRRVRSSADADDIVQSVVLRMLEQRDLASVGSPHAWLTTAARRAVTDLHRANGTAASAQLEEHSLAADEALGASDAARCLAPLVAKLSPQERALLERVDVEGESQASLAREVGLSPSALKSRVQRARARLRQSLLSSCIVELDRLGHPSSARCRPSSGATPQSCGDCGE